MKPPPTSTRTARRTYEIIWDVVRQVPRGRVATYGEIAEHAGFPGRARLVGYALHNTPRGSDIPWHRIVNAQGNISLPKTTGAYRRQRRLLEAEGVQFDGERIDLKKFRWLRRLARGYHIPSEGGFFFFILTWAGRPQPKNPPRIYTPACGRQESTRRGPKSLVAISEDSCLPCLPAGRRGHKIFAFCAQISLLKY